MSSIGIYEILLIFFIVVFNIAAIAGLVFLILYLVKRSHKAS